MSILGSLRGADGRRLVWSGPATTFVVESESDVYVKIWTIDGHDKATLLFPNEVETNNLVRAREPRQVPGPDRDYHLKSWPDGREWFHVTASTQPWAGVKGGQVVEHVRTFPVEQRPAILDETRLMRGRGVGIVPGKAAPRRIPSAELLIPYEVLDQWPPAG